MQRIKVLGVFFVVLMIAGFSLASVPPSIPQLINYQGRLQDDAGTPLDGVSVDLTFNFYDLSSGDTVLLTVAQQNVIVTQGIYNVLIGSGAITPGTESTLADLFQKHAAVMMGVAVNTDPEMTPRARIASVPYALAIDAAAIYNAIAKQPDLDNDGHQSPLVGGDDCNDMNPAVYSCAPELCDGIDNQCPGDPCPGHGQVDEGCYQCNDLLDNDGDARIDMADPGCDNPFDNDESEPTACNDGIDNDGWGDIDLADPGCSASGDTTETNPAAICDNGQDDDGWFDLDYMDPGCAGPTDPDETDPSLICDNGLDDDGWFDPDFMDMGCADPTDPDETDPMFTCDNGIDDDGWGDPDFFDPGCMGPFDPDEFDFFTQCDDGIDNDLDSFTDVLDPQCFAPFDPDEAF